MQRHDPRLSIGNYRRQPASPLTRLLSSMAAIALLVVGFMFSIVAAVFILGLLLIAGLYLWWKTRDVRKLMRDAQKQAAAQHAAQDEHRHTSHEQAAEPRSGLTIEGESARIDD